MLERDGHQRKMDNTNALIERLERVIETLSENSIKMGQMLAVHDEKLDKQDRIDAVLFEKVESVHREINRQAEDIKKGCERDIRKVDDRLRIIEKKMWTIFGALSMSKCTFEAFRRGPFPVQCSELSSSRTPSLFQAL